MFFMESAITSLHSLLTGTPFCIKLANNNVRNTERCWDVKSETFQRFLAGQRERVNNDVVVFITTRSHDAAVG